MSEEKEHRKQEEVQSLSEKPLSEEEQVRLLLEQARQEVKRMAQKEREGEKISKELLNFRMRQSNDP